MTTSSRPANAAPLPDRRRFLSTVAGAGAIGFTTLPALAADGDAHLFELRRRLAHLSELAAEADRQLNAASDVYERAAPETPEALFVRPGDNLALRCKPEFMTGKPTGRYQYVSEDIKIAEAAFLRAGDLPPAPNTRIAMNLSRTREIIASWRPYHEATVSAWEAAGLEAAENASTIAHEHCMELRSQIARCPATTTAGVLIKARVVAEDSSEIDCGDIGDGTFESMVLSIARDLIGISNGTVAEALHA